MAMVSPFSALLSAKVEESGSSVPSLYSLISFGSWMTTYATSVFCISTLPTLAAFTGDTCQCECLCCYYLQGQRVTFSTSSCNLAFTSEIVSERSMCTKNVDFLRFTFMYTHLLVLSSPVYPSVACAQHHLLVDARANYVKQKDCKFQRSIFKVRQFV